MKVANGRDGHNNTGKKQLNPNERRVALNGKQIASWVEDLGQGHIISQGAISRIRKHNGRKDNLDEGSKDKALIEEMGGKVAMGEFTCRQLRRRVKGFEKTLGQVAEFLSHDLRSCMVSIGGFGAILSGEVKRMRHRKSRHYINRIERNIQEMDASVQAMIRQIRAVSRIDDFESRKTVGNSRSYNQSGKPKGE